MSKQTTNEDGTKLEDVIILMNDPIDRKNPKQGYIAFDVTKRDELRAAYDVMKDKGDYKFEFNGYTLLVGYAKYLLEYLDGRFNTGS